MEQLKKEVWIQIKGTQKTEDESDHTELYTQGKYYKKGDRYYISYEESEATGFEGCRTTLKIDGNQKVTMIRQGTSRSNLLIEKGRRNVGYYGTEFGELVIGVNAQEIDANLDEHGGTLFFSYALDINSGHVSDNEIHIQIKENDENISL